jgi:hypothetical protein
LKRRSCRKAGIFETLISVLGLAAMARLSLCQVIKFVIGTLLVNGLSVRFHLLISQSRGYDDMATITFANGQKAVLRTDKLDVLGAELDPWLNQHDQDSTATDYKPSLKGKELREARGYLNFGDEQLQQDDNASIPTGQPITTNQNATAPYLGTTGQDNSSNAAPTPDATPDATPAAPAAPANAPDPIEDMEAGDPWHGESGDYLGSFVEAQLVTSDDGTTEAWAVIYMDANGDEQLEIVPKGEARGPK